MTQDQLTDLATFLLRVALGVMFLAHSVILKLFVFTLPGLADYFGSIGLPPAFGYVVFAAEAVGGAMLVLGVQTRWVALGLTPILIGATWAHAGNGWVFIAPGGGWEYPAILALLGLLQAMLGDGRYALSPTKHFPVGR